MRLGALLVLPKAQTEWIAENLRPYEIGRMPDQLGYQMQVSNILQKSSNLSELPVGEGLFEQGLGEPSRIGTVVVVRS